MHRAKVVWDNTWKTWAVDCGYYGAVEIMQPAWTVEYAGTRENAERIVRNAAKIEEIIGRKHTRLTIRFSDENTMTIINYDTDGVLAADVPAIA